jgi:hypothetical protein
LRAPQMSKRKVPRTDNRWRDLDHNLCQYIRGQSDMVFLARELGGAQIVGSRLAGATCWAKLAEAGRYTSIQRVADWLEKLGLLVATVSIRKSMDRRRRTAAGERIGNIARRTRPHRAGYQALTCTHRETQPVDSLHKPAVDA